LNRQPSLKAQYAAFSWTLMHYGQYKFVGQFSRGLVPNYILTVGFGARLLALARKTQVLELCTEVGLRG